jgi:hypothetical protein
MTEVPAPPGRKRKVKIIAMSVAGLRRHKERPANMLPDFYRAKDLTVLPPDGTIRKMLKSA